MKAQHILSIDLGTTGIKAALVRDGGEIAASTSRPVETILVPPDGAEQNAEKIWTATKSAMHQVICDAACSPDEIIGVAVASQFSSVVPVDRFGQPVMNLILWMDSRGAPHARDIYGRHSQALATWIDVHGAMPLPSGNDSLSHMLWVASSVFPTSFPKNFLPVWKDVSLFNGTTSNRTVSLRRWMRLS